MLPQEQVCLTPAGIMLGHLDPRNLNLIWLLGFGRRQSCIDRFQILSRLDDSLFVNPPQTMMNLHAKYSLNEGALQDLFPPSWVSGDGAWLKARIQSGGEWVIKPTAGSYGKDVYRVSASTQKLDSILNSLTDGAYAVLQTYVPEIEQGEKRVLIANGKIIGSYLRTSAENFRTNLSVGATCNLCSLSTSEKLNLALVMDHLEKRKIRFAAIDLAERYVIEVNVANPGGLQTLKILTGEDTAYKTALSFS